MSAKGAGVVRLRPVAEADLPILFEHQADPVATEMAAFPARPLPEFMAHWAAVLSDPALYARAIVADEDGDADGAGQVVGTLVSWMEGDHREVGYWLGRAYWGRGYATRAVELFLGEMAERPIVAHVADQNVGSRTVLERCGFVRVGGADVDGVVESIFRLD